MSVIEIAELTRDYGNNQGVFNLSIDVQQGEVFGFLGPNGAGKTTTIRHLMGFIKAQNGICQINGLDCWSQRAEIQKVLGYIPGEMSFFEQMTGTEYLQFVSNYRGIVDMQTKQHLIERFELDTKAKINQMSKGTKQKLGIVAAMMHNPAILILDEPTSSLDPLMQQRFIEWILEEKRQQKTILLSSHMFEEVERTCDRIGMIRQGKLVATDSVDNLRKQALKTYTVKLESVEQAKLFAQDFGGVCEQEFVTLSAMKSLEQIFMSYYGGQAND